MVVHGQMIYGLVLGACSCGDIGISSGPVHRELVLLQRSAQVLIVGFRQRTGWSSVEHSCLKVDLLIPRRVRICALPGSALVSCIAQKRKGLVAAGTTIQVRKLRWDLEAQNSGLSYCFY